MNINIKNPEFYFVCCSSLFCKNRKDIDIFCVPQTYTHRVDRGDGYDIFYIAFDRFRELLFFKCTDKDIAYRHLYNIAYAIRKCQGEIKGTIPDDIADYNFFDYKEEIVKSCINSCETYALHPRLSNPINKDMCLKNTYWIFANYFALVNNSFDFTQEQLDIIQKCHDNELPRSYAEDLYQKLLAMLPKQELQEVEQPTISYDELVDSKIRARYTVSQEFAILRQRDTKPNEFAEYNAYCEQCKAKAKAELGIG